MTCAKCKFGVNTIEGSSNSQPEGTPSVSHNDSPVLNKSCLLEGTELAISLLCLILVPRKYFSVIPRCDEPINVSRVRAATATCWGGKNAVPSRHTHGPEWLRMARMLSIAHAARYGCQAARNQARPRWGTIDKFEVTTTSRQVTAPLHYLKGRVAPQSQSKSQDAGTRMRQVQG